MYYTITTPTECLQCARYNAKPWTWQPKAKDSNVTEPGSRIPGIKKTIINQKMRVYQQYIVVYHLAKSKYSAGSTPVGH